MTDAQRSDRKLTETTQITHPGWTRLQWRDATDGHDLLTQFRGPGGEIVSRHEFRKRLASGEVATIDPSTGAAKPAAAARLAEQNNPPALGAAPVANTADANQPFDLPEPQVDSARGTPPGQATPAQLSLTAQIALTVLTSLLSLLTRTPELTMSEIEAQSISVPLANLAAKSQLNRRFGRYLADSSDYTLLGYALYAYGWRVAGQVAQRTQAEQAATERGFPHAVPQAARPQPVPSAASSSAATGSGGGTAERSAPASGGIGGAVRGPYVPAEAARIVGFNPIPHPGAS